MAPSLEVPTDRGEGQALDTLEFDPGPRDGATPARLPPAVSGTPWEGSLPGGPTFPRERGAEAAAAQAVEGEPAWADGPALEYAGRDNLEVMQQAFNYNRLLLGWIRERAQGAHRVVDFGAGAGAFAVPLQRAGCPVECVELDPVLRGRLRDQGLRVMATLDGVEDGSVDFLYAFDVLEHIADDTGCLRQWHRKLAPGGSLLLYVPAFQVLFSSMDRRIGHHRRYRRAPLQNRVRAAGFQVEFARYVDCLGFFGSLAYRMTDRGTGTLAWRAVKFYDRYLFPASRVLDLCTHRWLGKNLLLAARKPTAPAGAP